MVVARSARVAPSQCQRSVMCRTRRHEPDPTLGGECNLTLLPPTPAATADLTGWPGPDAGAQRGEGDGLPGARGPGGDAPVAPRLDPNGCADVLQHAAFRGDVDTVVRLLRDSEEQGGALNVNARNAWGWTALHFSAVRPQQSSPPPCTRSVRRQIAIYTTHFKCYVQIE